MKKTILSLGFIFTFIFISAKVCFESKVITEKTGNQTFIIDSNMLEEFKKAASLGNSESAFKLYQHYEFGVSDLDEGLYWLKVSAENGHQIAQYNYVSILLEDSDSDTRRKGRYLAKKYYEQGNKSILELLKEEGKTDNTNFQ